MIDQPLIDEGLIGRLPLPLAHLYRRADNAKTPLERHQAAFYLWEAALKLLSSVAVVSYADTRHHDEQLLERLKSLARPALGHWWEYIRLLTPILADLGDPGFTAVREFLLGRTRDDLPCVTDLDAALLEVLEGRQRVHSTVRLTELFDRLVHYRNQEIGHGIAGLKPPAFYDRMGRTLLAAMTQLLGRLDVLAGRRLLFLAELRQPSGSRWLVDRFELRGEAAQRIESLDLPASGAIDQLRSGRLYLAHGSNADDALKQTWSAESQLLGEQYCSLHPLLLQDFETGETLFLNSRRGKRRLEFLSYSTGRIAERDDLPAEQRQLLARVLDLPVASREMEQWAEQSHADEESSTASAPTLTMPRCLGEFELISELGRGGMGVVYRAWQPSLGREVAVKVLYRTGDAKAEARFAREIRSLGRVEHPNLVKIFTSGNDGDRWFYAMELVEGATLAEVCQRLSKSDSRPDTIDADTWQATVANVWDQVRQAEKPLSDSSLRISPIDNPQSTAPGNQDKETAEGSTLDPRSLKSPGRGSREYVRQVVDLVRRVALACHALHEQGILHRDVKPGNIILSAADGRPVLMDLGLAQVADEVEGRLTRTRQFIGTLRYASPEQVLSVGGLDRRSDVFGLGASLWELLTLRTMFNANDQTPNAELMRRIQLEEVERPSRYHRGLSRDLDAIVLKCLEKDPRRRYATALDLGNDLQRFLVHEPVRARPVRSWERNWRWVKRRPVAAGFVVVTVLLVLALVAGAVSLYYARQVSSQRDLAREAQTKEVEARKRAEIERAEAQRQRQRGDQLLYLNGIAMAQREIEFNNLGRAADILDACPWDLRGWEWHYLRRGSRLAHTFRGHLDRVLSVDFSPDGRSAVSSGADGTVQLWQVQTGRLLHSWPEWAIRTGLDSGGRDGEAVEIVRFSPDGKYIAAATAGGTIKVWDARVDPEHAGKELHRFPGPTRPRCLIWSPSLPGDSPQWLASAGADARIFLWDLRQHNPAAQQLEAGTANFRSLSFHPDGGRLAAGGSDVRIWDVKTKRRLATFDVGSLVVTGVAFSPDGASLLVVGQDAKEPTRNLPGLPTIRIWNANDGKPRLTVQEAGISSAAWSPDGQYFVTGDIDKKVKARFAASGEEMFSLEGHGGTVTSVAVSPDGGHIASASDDRTVKVWKTYTGLDPLVLTPPGETRGGVGLTPLPDGNAVRAAVFSPDGQAVVSVGDEDYSHIWDLRAEPKDRKFQLNPGGFLTVCFRPDGRQIASAGKDGWVDLANPRADGASLRFQAHTDALRWIGYSPDSKWLATGGTDADSAEDVIKIWDAETGNERTSLQEQQGSVNAAAFSPDGQRLVIVGEKTVRLREVASTKRPAELEASHLRPLRCVAWSPRGIGPGADVPRSLVVAGDMDGGITVWDVETRKEILNLQGHTAAVTSVAFSPDGKRLISSSADRTLRVWHAESGEECLTLRGHSAGVNSVAFSPDGSQIVSAGDDGTIRIWDTRNGVAVLPLRGSRHPLGDLAASAEGDRILATPNPGGKRESSILAWDTRTGRMLESSPDLPDALFSTLVRPTGGPDAAPRRETRCPMDKWEAWINGNSVQTWWGGAVRRQQEQEDRDLRVAWHRRQARIGEESRQWFSAAFHLERLSKLGSVGKSQYLRSGNAWAEQGHWKEALEAFALAAQGPSVELAALERQALVVLAADRRSYPRLCKELNERMGPLPTPSALRCVLLAADNDLERNNLVDLAEQALKSGRNDPQVQENYGAALYRAGRHEEAERHLSAAVKRRGQDGTATQRLYLALALHKRGQKDEAQRLWHSTLPEAQQRRLVMQAAALVVLGGEPGAAALRILQIQILGHPANTQPTWQERLAQQVLRQEVEAALKEPK
jgi:eukaryotic-like serine/threonine-protein kinase